MKKQNLLPQNTLHEIRYFIGPLRLVSKDEVQLIFFSETIVSKLLPAYNCMPRDSYQELQVIQFSYYLHDRPFANCISNNIKCWEANGHAKQQELSDFLWIN